MTNVLFVCLGNICRSPMAELIFKKLVSDVGLELEFTADSCGTSDCEEGNGIYEPAKRTLAAHGIFGRHTARQLTRADIIDNDYILVMDSSNLLDVLRFAGEANRGKVYKLLSFASSLADVADPWYTRDFERAYSDISNGCAALLDYLIKSGV